MVSRATFIVFIVPAAFSILFGSAVMADIEQRPGRTLELWPGVPSLGSGDSSSIRLVGLEPEYSPTVLVEARVMVTDPSYDCGDLYITVYPSGSNTALVQQSYLNQCYGDGVGTLPLNASFSRVIGQAGVYRMVAEMVSVDLDRITTSGTFTVK